MAPVSFCCYVNMWYHDLYIRASFISSPELALGRLLEFLMIIGSFSFK